MGSRLNPYINFRDNAAEAMAFYRGVFGGELTSMTFADGGMEHEPADAAKVMHAQLETPNGMTLMAADTPSGVPWSAPASWLVNISGGAQP